eukprot:12504507-Alexandrium_andersonii.AAC.1
MPTTSLLNAEAGQAPKPPALQGALGCVASVRAARATHTANNTPRATAMAPVVDSSQGGRTAETHPLPRPPMPSATPTQMGAESGWALPLRASRDR